MKSTMLRLEVLTAALLPAVAILLVGVIATKQMENSSTSGLLPLVFIGCALGVSLGEVILIHLMQRATKEQFHEIISTCQQYIAGDQAARLKVHGDNALTLLTQMLNNLLDAVSTPQYHKPSSVPGKDNSRQVSQLETQLQQLIIELTPVMSGDLRVKVDVSTGNVGTIAGVCNALIEEVVELIQWTRYSSRKVIGDTRKLLNGSVELAQTVETQMLHFSQTTEAVEKLVAFLQRLNSTLQLNVDNIQGVQKALQQYRQKSEHEYDEHLLLLDEDTRRQAQLLEELLNSTQFHTSLAERMISDFYTFAKRIHQSCSNMLQTTEQINALATLADQWYNATISFHLPGDDDSSQMSNANQFAPSATPSPSSSRPSPR